MADRSDMLRRRPGAPLRPRSRRRWAVAAGIGCLWVVLLADTGSLIAATALLLLIAVAAVACAAALRSLGVNGDHPWVRLLAARPWRDGTDVLRLGLRHMSGVFIVSPAGSMLAPNAVELLMSPGDLASLTEAMDLALVNASATELYQEQVMAHGARLASIGPLSASVAADPAVPPGRYRLRQARSAGPGYPPGSGSPDGYPAPPVGYPAPPVGYPAPPVGYPEPPDGYPVPADWHPAYPNGQVFAHARDGQTRKAPDGARPDDARPDDARPDDARTVLTGQLTVMETAPVPVLRLVTRGSTAETRVSGARAGRGDAVELRLPEEPTVSRVHATFVFADGHWWITPLGRNGVTLNGTPLAGEHALGDGDSIWWGRRSDALTSRVEIG